MSTKDETFLKDLENQIKTDLKEKVFINNVSQLKDFPFKDFQEICLAIEENRIALASDYNYDRLAIYATKSEFKWQTFWLALPFVIALCDIILALILKKYILLFGILASFLGHFTSSPYFKPRNAMASLTSIISIICIFLNWKLAVILGSYSLSLIFTMTARESCQQVIIRRALSSETFFVWLFLARVLLIRDNKTMQIIQPHD